jgi:hypothetical protein
MSGQLIPPQLPEDRELAHKMLDNTGVLDKMRAERGALGGFWGASSHIPHNIAALLVLLLTLTGIGFTLCKVNAPIDDKSLSIKDFWAIITPLITLAVGYLFGEKTKQATG